MRPASDKVALLALMASVAIAYAERSSVAHLIPAMLADGTITKDQGVIILAAFGLGYVVGLPLSGKLINWFGHRRLLTVMGAGWTTSCLLFAISPHWYGWVGSRFVLGILEAPLFPLFVSWISAHSRREIVPVRISLVEACSYVGMAIAGPASVALMGAFGWRLAYVGLGALGLVVVAVAQVVPPTPFEPVSQRPSRTWAFRELVPVLALACGFFLYNLIKTFYSTWLPTLLIQSFSFTSWSAARLTFVQSLIGPLASVGSSLLAVRLARRMPVSRARFLVLAIGFCCAAMIALIGVDVRFIWLFAILGFAGIISTSGLIWATVPELSERGRVASLAGWINAFANLATMMSPVVLGAMLEQPAVLLSFLALTALLTIPIFAIACRGPRRPA